MRQSRPIAIGVLLSGVSLLAQTSAPNSAPPTESDVSSASHTADAAKTRRALEEHIKGPNNVDILSDTMGFDFNPYLQQIFHTVDRHWRLVMPESVYPPILKKGIVFIEFSIMKDGTVQGLKVVGPPADMALVRAAWVSITVSAPFPPLPSEFPGQYLRLRFKYFYNLNLDGTSANEVPVSISPSAPVTLAAGSTRQFSANVGARGVAAPEWTIATDECAIRSEWTSVLIFTKSECGTVSASGLYTAPDKVPEPPNIAITATSVPLKSASTQVTIVAPSSTK